MSNARRERKRATRAAESWTRTALKSEGSADFYAWQAKKNDTVSPFAGLHIGWSALCFYVLIVCIDFVFIYRKMLFLLAHQLYCHCYLILEGGSEKVKVILSLNCHTK